MARPRDPRRDQAKQIWLDSNGEIKLVDLAVQFEVTSSTIRKWKATDKWDNEMKGSAPKQMKKSAPFNNFQETSNSNRKRSGNPNPSYKFSKHNKAAEKHGFFSKFLPEETLEIMEAMNQRSPADLIWDQIQIQYAAIIRAQKIMNVTAKDEMVKELKKAKYDFIQKGKGEQATIERVATEEEYEFQFAWERQAQFLTAQSRAISELRTSIKQFISLVDEEDERKLKLEQMQLNIEKTKTEINKLNADISKDDDKPIEIVIKRKGEK